jgi:hypothetical protein
MALSAANPNSDMPTVPAVIEQYFQVCLLLLLSTGFITLASTGKLDMLSVLFVSIALLYRGYLLGHGRVVRIPEQITSYLGVVYILVYVVDFFFVSDNFVQATVHLLLFGMVVKMFSVQRNRDFVYLAMLAFLEVLSAAILTVDSVFLGSLSIFLLIAVLTFISLEMRRSSLRGGFVQNIGSQSIESSRKKKRVRVFSYSITTTGMVLVVAILIASVGIFFSLPRLSGGYLSKLAQQNDLVSGFSDNVSLGEIGRIQQSSQVVMHVRVENGEKGPGILMRGNSLSDFDGKNWLNPPHYAQAWNNIGGSFDVRLPAQLRHLRLAEGSPHRIVKYRVMLEPIGTNVIFTIPSPDYLFGPFREVSIDHAQTLLNTDRDRPTGNYGGISDLSQPTLQELEQSSGEYPAEVQLRYTKLPDTLDPRIADLAHQITAKVKTPIEKAAAIQAYLSKYRYTLELPSQRQKDPVAYFLFERKAGHCEYFASAMAVLLREEGIPSRIVNGFRGGEWNELTGNFIIRAKDAHSWVEVYFPGVGWYAFDPTPQGSLPVITMWNRVSLYIDAAREFWREWIVNYDFVHQERLANSAAGASTRMFDRFKLWAHRKYESMLNSARNTHKMMVKSPRAYGGSAVLFISGVILLFNIPRVARALKMQSIARNPAKAPQGAASIWYGRMTSAMARRGHRKSPTQTPAEFAENIDDPHLRGGVARFTKHYERARFGNSAEDAVKLPEIYEELVEKN